jgi:uncharacterized membrane protein YsdA (DUF1294 family)
MDLKEMGCECVDWIHLAQDRDEQWAVMNAVMNLKFSYKVENFMTTKRSSRFPSRVIPHGISYLVVGLVGWLGVWLVIHLMHHK